MRLWSLVVTMANKGIVTMVETCNHSGKGVCHKVGRKLNYQYCPPVMVMLAAASACDSF